MLWGLGLLGSRQWAGLQGTPRAHFTEVETEAEARAAAKSVCNGTFKGQGQAATANAFVFVGKKLTFSELPWSLVV